MWPRLRGAQNGHRPDAGVSFFCAADERPVWRDEVRIGRNEVRIYAITIQETPGDNVPEVRIKGRASGTGPGIA